MLNYDTDPTEISLIAAATPRLPRETSVKDLEYLIHLLRFLSQLGKYENTLYLSFKRGS